VEETYILFLGENQHLKMSEKKPFGQDVILGFI
jgi:hypothetical protein